MLSSFKLPPLFSLTHLMVCFHSLCSLLREELLEWQCLYMREHAVVSFPTYTIVSERMPMFLHSSMKEHPSQEKLPVCTGLGGHINHQSCSVSTPSACLFKSVVGILEVSY